MDDFAMKSATESKKDARESEDSSGLECGSCRREGSTFISGGLLVCPGREVIGKRLNMTNTGVRRRALRYFADCRVRHTGFGRDFLKSPFCGIQVAKHEIEDWFLCFHGHIVYPNLDNLQ